MRLVRIHVFGWIKQQEGKTVQGNERPQNAVHRHDIQRSCKSWQCNKRADQAKSVGCSSNCEWTCSANVNGFTACREVLFWISSIWTELQLCLSIRLTGFLSVKVNMMPFHVIMNTHRVAILSISLACVTGHQGSLLRKQVGRCQCWWTRVSHNYWYYIEWQEQTLCFKRRGWGSAAAVG